MPTNLFVILLSALGMLYVPSVVRSQNKAESPTPQADDEKK